MPDGSEMALTNIDPNKVAEALATKIRDMTSLSQAMNGVKKVRKAMKTHETYYEEQHGIDASVINDRYAEMKMTPRERERKYVLEQVSRRALNLWDAESPEEFEELLAAAQQIEAASGESADRLVEARARADGFNSGMNGASPLADNPHYPGTLEHQAWALGCADAVGETRPEAGPMQAAQPGDPPAAAAQKKARGRPRKQASASTDGEPASEDSDSSTTPGPEPVTQLFDVDEEMPAVPALPE